MLEKIFQKNKKIFSKKNAQIFDIILKEPPKILMFYL